jgi:hypothetical protein
MAALDKRHSDADEKLESVGAPLPEVGVHDIAQDGKAAVLDHHGNAHLQYDPAVMKSLVRKLDIHCARA